MLEWLERAQQARPHTPLLRRIWELRHNFTVYDAAYVALAEETNSILYTIDEKLRRRKWFGWVRWRHSCGNRGRGLLRRSR